MDTQTHCLVASTSSAGEISILDSSDAPGFTLGQLWDSLVLHLIILQDLVVQMVSLYYHQNAMYLASQDTEIPEVIVHMCNV